MDGYLLACLDPRIIYLMLAAIVTGLVTGVLLLRWFWIASGLGERQFRSSLRTLVLFVLAVASAFSLCVAIDGFWLPELFLCAFTIPAFIWSLFRDRKLLGPPKRNPEKRVMVRRGVQHG